MKKILTGLLALVMLMSSVFVLSSCSAEKPELDLDDAKKALEEAEYDVTYDEKYDEPGIVARLYARKGIGEESEWGGYDDYYRVYIYECEKSSTASLLYKQQKKELEMEIEYYKMEIKYLEHILDKYEDDMDSEEINECKDEIKEMKKELEELEDYVVGKSGKYVWYGDAKAIKATKD